MTILSKLLTSIARHRLRKRFERARNDHLALINAKIMKARDAHGSTSGLVSEKDYTHAALDKRYIPADMRYSQDPIINDIECEMDNSGCAQNTLSDGRNG